MERVDIAIIGAGVIGLAIAARLGERRKDIVVIERHSAFGQETSSRNSEVIHAGIYYPKDSLKTKLCVEGKMLLYDFCKRYGIRCKKTGKLIVATNKEEANELGDLIEQAMNNGIDDLKLLSRDETIRLEPHTKCISSILSPSTGIVDSYGLMKRLEFIAKERGVIFAYHHELRGTVKNSFGYGLEIIDKNCRCISLSSDIVINCAGLNSDKVAQMAGIDIERNRYKLYYSKGEYFRIKGNRAGFINHLIYPTPKADSLGIHTVIDLNGQLKLGPNAFYVNAIDYDVDHSHKREFYDTTSKYLDFINWDDIAPDNSGIRPKLQAPSQAFRDFIISNEADKGLDGFINLIGIESPGITASLSVAEYVNNML